MRVGKGAFWAVLNGSHMPHETCVSGLELSVHRLLLYSVEFAFCASRLLGAFERFATTPRDKRGCG